MKADNTTMRTINGTFHKQRWVGHNEDQCEEIEEIKFDATEAILRMNLESLHGLQDHDETSDRFGRDHVDHSGPCEVEIVDEVQEFFGVESLKDITQEVFDAALKDYLAQPYQWFVGDVTRTATETKTLGIKARSAGEARRKLSELAGDMEWGTGEADYEIDQPIATPLQGIHHARE